MVREPKGRTPNPVSSLVSGKVPFPPERPFLTFTAGESLHAGDKCFIGEQGVFYRLLTQEEYENARKDIAYFKERAAEETKKQAE